MSENDMNNDNATGVVAQGFQDAIAALEAARVNFGKDMTTSADLPVAPADGPSANNRKKRKQDQGKCAPYAKVKVEGYTRVLASGKVVHVGGYVREGLGGLNAMDDATLERKASNPRNKVFNFGDPRAFHPVVSQQVPMRQHKKPDPKRPKPEGKDFRSMTQDEKDEAARIMGKKPRQAKGPQNAQRVARNYHQADAQPPAKKMPGNLNHPAEVDTEELQAAVARYRAMGDDPRIDKLVAPLEAELDARGAKLKVKPAEKPAAKKPAAARQRPLPKDMQAAARDFADDPLKFAIDEAVRRRRADRRAAGPRPKAPDALNDPHYKFIDAAGAGNHRSRVKRGNIVRIKGKKGNFIVTKRSGRKVTVTPKVGGGRATQDDLKAAKTQTFDTSNVTHVATGIK